MAAPLSFASARVPSPIPDVYYIPNFISEEEEAYLLRKVAESSKVAWRNVKGRRLQVWGGEITSTRNGSALVPSAMPAYMTEFPDILPRLGSLGVFKDTKMGMPNHVILNEYKPGEGIMPHEDGPSYYPAVATISLGSHTVFHYHAYKADSDSLDLSMNPSNLQPLPSLPRPIHPTPILTLILEPRSVVITTSQLYTSHLHAIESLSIDDFSYRASPTTKHDLDTPRVSIANLDMIEDTRIRGIIESGGQLERGIRTSLTCRVVERVVGGSRSNGKGGPLGHLLRH